MVGYQELILLDSNANALSAIHVNKVHIFFLSMIKIAFSIRNINLLSARKHILDTDICLFVKNTKKELIEDLVTLFFWFTNALQSVTILFW